MGRPKGSKNTVPRSDQKKLNQAAAEAEDDILNSIGSDGRTEISAEEAKEGALTTEARNTREKFDRLVELKNSGRGKGIKMDLPAYDLWNLCVKTKGTDRTKVQLERTRPGEANCDIHAVRNVTAYEDLIALIKVKYWDGTEQTYRWSFRDAYGRLVASNYISFPEDPVQKAAWARREAQTMVRPLVEAPVAAIAAQVPVQPIVQRDPLLEALARSVERLESRFERGQQLIDEPVQEPAPAAAPAQPTNPQPKGEWKWDGQTWVWKMEQVPPPQPQAPPSPPPNWGWPPPGSVQPQMSMPGQPMPQQWWPQQQMMQAQPQMMPAQPQVATRELTELARSLAMAEGELSAMKEQIKRVTEAQQHPQMQQQQPFGGWQNQQNQPSVMQPAQVAPSTSTVIKEAKETVTGLAELAKVMSSFGPKEPSAASSVFGSVGVGAVEAAEKEDPFPIRPLDAGGWQMWFNSKTQEPIDVASQVAMNLGNITEAGSKLVGSIFDNLKKMREEESKGAVERREMIAYMRQQQMEKKALEERLVEISRALPRQNQTFDAPLSDPPPPPEAPVEPEQTQPVEQPVSEQVPPPPEPSQSQVTEQSVQT